tara:strand:- start:307 stop:513 length:207 start_codon:yes stop_codon:yes gene_type:complete
MNQIQKSLKRHIVNALTADTNEDRQRSINLGRNLLSELTTVEVESVLNEVKKTEHYKTLIKRIPIESL